MVELEKETECLVSQFDAAGRILKTAIKARRAAQERATLSQKWARAKDLDEEITGLDRRLIEVNKLLAERTAARDHLIGIKIGKGTFEEIQRLESTMREARAALGAIATRVRFSSADGKEVRKADTGILVEESIEITEPTRFALEGFGRVDIEPGASELADRRRRFAQAESDLGKALIAAGAEDIVQARSHLEQRIEAETSAKGAKQESG